MTRYLGLLLPMAWRNLWRNPRRTLITLVVVAVGMWSILIFSVVLQAWATSTREQALRVLTGEAQIHAAHYVDDPNVSHRLPKPAGALLRALDQPDISAWTARVRVPAIIQSEYRTRATTLVGVDPRSERQISDLPSQIPQGRYLAGPDDHGIVLGVDLAARLKTRLGKRVIVMAQAADGHLAETSFTIVGLFGSTRPTEDEFIFAGRRVTQAMLGIGDDISEISFDTSDERQLPAVVDALKRAAPGADVKSWTEFSPIAYAIESFSQSYVTVWLFIMFVLMAIGIVNTQLMAVFERTREFGLLQALGMRPGLVLLQVSIESALIVGLGVASGVGLTLLSLLPFRNGLDLGFLAAGAEMYGAGSVLHPRFDAFDAIRFSLVIWGLGIVATLWPARRASHTDPVVAMTQS
jgi:ABC-type lipoprotein release transport system permease subunit